MRIFDLHADLAIAIRQYPNETAVLKNHWDKRLEKGEIMYSAAASFFAGRESWQEQCLPSREHWENMVPQAC